MARKYWPLLLLYVSLRISGSQGTGELSQRNREVEDHLNRILDSGNYNKAVRPAGNNGSGEDAPTIVTVSIVIKDIEFIDDVRMEFGMQMIIRQYWVDDRLRFDNLTLAQGANVKYVNIRDFSKLWYPDIYVVNDRKTHIHQFLAPNALIRIDPDGSILFSVRLSMVVHCPMNLRFYPFDRPRCVVKLESFALPTSALILKWRSVSPIYVIHPIELPRFKLEKYYVTSCTATPYSCESFSVITWHLKFKRDFTFYLLQIYIPGCMLVVISWVGFWLDGAATDARISLGVTTILTLVTQTYGINQASPSVSYIKASDVWTGACQLFVVAALLQFSLINQAQRIDAKTRAENAAKNFEIQGLDSDKWGKKRSTWVFSQAGTSRADRIDKVCRVLFPACFFAFNLVYWTVYLSYSY